MIARDLPGHGYKKAASDLIHGAEFRHLYLHTNDIPAEMILEQADPSPEIDRNEEMTKGGFFVLLKI